MSWYSQPIQPLDPVVQSQVPKAPFRYIRGNFAGTGQHSYIKAPSQDQSQWQSLLNVQPITQGILNQRWGYTQFVAFRTGFNPLICNRLYNFQSDSLGTRAIIAAGLGGIAAFNENGTTYATSIFNPSATAGIVRSITSRNFQYFCDGNNALNPSTHLTGDSLKWDGSAIGGHGHHNPQAVTNIGIVNTDVTVNAVGGGGSNPNTIGPNTGSTASDLADNANAWTNVSGIFTNSIGTAAFANVFETITGTLNQRTGNYSYTYSNINLITDTVEATGFNFASVSSPTVAGIQVAVQYQATLTNPNGNFIGSSSLTAQLVKNNTAMGTAKTSQINFDGATHTFTFGSATDLWGNSFAPADITNAQFGFEFRVNSNFQNAHDFQGSSTPNINVKIPFVTITVYLTGSSGTSSSSNNGVGFVNAVGGGSINLTIGRIYYLVPNNSLTGHFGDLSSPSGSTGSELNSENNLILATYNDPQVDTKYVLATPDGGDPSVLYEVSVLVPGFNITSWVINGSNQVTFTGTYTGPQFVTGQQIVIGGLSHGSYMNNQTITVGAFGNSTTIHASFTHGADSATEPGIAGNYSFAIPNNVTSVVDNTPDPSLVLNQPLLFTDTSGNEFGVTLNDPPPAGNLLIKHQGRLWMAGVPGATHSVFFTKSVTELTLPDGFIAGKYEESWPGSNYFDVSDGAESVAGFLSDGTTLYIGTQNHIRRLQGNSPATFQEPQIVHPQVGLLNQEVWQIVYMQGAPSGSIWMTPDFRVMQSDFNTYVDVGTPIQDILNNLQTSAQTLAHATFFADGEYELYDLAVPYLQSTYCDTHLIFDLRARQWFVWQPAGGSLSLLYNITQAGIPQWLFINGAGSIINLYGSKAIDDNGTIIPVTATTTWMDLGEPTRRKVLNEIQVYGNTTMTMNVYGSNNLADFTSTPRPIVYNRTLMQSPFGTWNLYLTGDKTRHRYYQFTFNSSNGNIPLLGSYAISAMPLDDL